MLYHYHSNIVVDDYIKEDTVAIKMSDKVALVTGSNAGIGYAIVEELIKRGVGAVYLTARNEERGRNAIKQMKAKGLNPLYHQLLVTDEESVKTCADYIKSKHGGLDILINNAGVITADLIKTTYEDAKRVIDTNYNGVLIIEKYFFPILKENARVVNISSDQGHISNLRNKEWIERLTKEDANRSDVDAFVNWFLDSVKNGTVNAEDFVQTSMLAYRVSKVALCALSKVQQRKIDRNISINSIHPGFVQTAMTKGSGYISMEESGEAPVFLALDIDQSVKGKYFWYDKTEKTWEDTSLPLFCDFEKIKYLLMGNQ